MSIVKKILFVCISFIFSQQTIIKASNQSCCQHLQEYAQSYLPVIDLFVARYLERQSDQTIISRAAGQKNPSSILYCLENNIGNIHSINEEGHSPISIARLLNHKEVEKIMISSPQFKQRKHLQLISVDFKKNN